MYSPSWNPFCPEGGQFYACGNGTKFVGCCDYLDSCVEPTGCSAGNLRQTSFDISQYGTFADQQCDAGLFYTCTGTTPNAFWGCCTINPCANNGCPRDDLAGAFLSNNPVDAAGMDPYPPVEGMFTSTLLSSSSTSTTVLASSSPPSSVPSTVSSGTSTAAAVTTSGSTPDSESKSVPTGAIAGGAVGGFVLLCAIVVIVWLVRRHARKSSDKHNRESRMAEGNAAGYSGAYDSNMHGKAAMSEIAAMNSPYRDSPSTVPPYSNQTSPVPHYHSGGWPTQPLQPHEYAQAQPIYEAESRSQFKAYSPPAEAAGHHSPDGGPQAQFSPSLSQNSDPMQSATWSNSGMGISAATPITSLHGNQGFARVHQGPPQELGGDTYLGGPYQNMGLGVHHLGGGGGGGGEAGYSLERPRVELDGGSSR